MRFLPAVSLSISLACLSSCDGSSGSSTAGESAPEIGAPERCWIELPKSRADSLAGTALRDSVARLGPSSRTCTRSTAGKLIQWQWMPGTTMATSMASSYRAGIFRSLTGGRSCTRMGADSTPSYFVIRDVVVRGNQGIHVGSANASCIETGLSRVLYGSCGNTVSILPMGLTGLSDSAVWARTDSVFASVCSAPR